MSPSTVIIAAGSGMAPLFLFIVYTGLVLVLAGLANRLLTEKGFVDEYYLGRRGLGVVAFTLTFGATAASAGSFQGFPSLVYTHGWVLALWIASYMVVPICGMAMLGKRLNQVARKSDAVTLPDVLRARFGSAAPAGVAILLLVFLLSFYLLPQFKAGAIILQQLLGDVSLLQSASSWMDRAVGGLPWLGSADPEYLTCLVLFSVLVVVYTTFGGFRAVVWTDVLQGFVMLFGVATLLILALAKTGGLSNVTRELAEMTPPDVGTLTFVAGDSASASEIRIPRDSWILDGEEVLRINEQVLIPVAADKESGLRIAKGIKAVRITTTSEIQRITSEWDGVTPVLPEGVTISERDLKAYEFGAGTPGVYTTAPGPSPSDAVGFLPIGLAISFFVYWALSGVGQPSSLVRLMAFDSTKTLRHAVAALTVYFGLIYFPIVIIFCCARVILPGLDQTPDRIMPALTFELSNWANMPWLAGLLIAAPFAAAMSTVDSLMLMISSSLVRDLYQQGLRPNAKEKTLKHLSYLSMLVVGFAMMMAAVNPPKFLQYIIVFTGGGLSVSFLMPMVLTLYWPRTTVQGVIAAMVGGLGVYLSLYVAGFVLNGNSTPYRLLQLDPLIWGFAASLLFGVAVSLITPALPNRLLNRYFARNG